jgi:hypothetical protein
MLFESGQSESTDSCSPTKRIKAGKFGSCLDVDQDGKADNRFNSEERIGRTERLGGNWAALVFWLQKRPYR